MRAFITGGTGFIGSTLARRLASEGHDVLRPSRGELDLLASSIDLPDGIDVIVHCAASRDRAVRCDGDFVREIRMNVDATARLLDVARARGVKRIVHISTISVLEPGPDASLDLPEDAPFTRPPDHPYSLTKRWSEELAVSLRDQFEAIAIVRPGMTYGAEMQPSCGMSRVVERIRSGQPYLLAAPNGHRFAPVHIDDVVDVIRHLSLATANVTLNVVGEPLWERRLVLDIAARIGVDIELEPTSEPALSVVPSTATLDAALPYRKKTPWASDWLLGWAAPAIVGALTWGLVACGAPAPAAEVWIAAPSSEVRASATPVEPPAGIARTLALPDAPGMISVDFDGPEGERTDGCGARISVSWAFRDRSPFLFALDSDRRPRHVTSRGRRWALVAEKYETTPCTYATALTVDDVDPILQVLQRSHDAIDVDTVERVALSIRELEADAHATSYRIGDRTVDVPASYSRRSVLAYYPNGSLHGFIDDGDRPCVGASADSTDAPVVVRETIGGMEGERYLDGGEIGFVASPGGRCLRVFFRAGGNGAAWVNNRATQEVGLGPFADEGTWRATVATVGGFVQ